MNTIREIENLVDHDLFHLRQGRGAVIVAVPREDVEKSRLSWDENEQGKLESAQQQRDSTREKIDELKQRIKDVGEIPWTEQTSKFIADANEQLAMLKSEYRACNYQPKEYFTGIQLARFYTHEIPSKSEQATRFDEILGIEEHGSHLKIALHFSTRPDRQHLFHSKIGVVKTSTTNRQIQIIEGVVNRIVPIGKVTLEIIGRV